MIMKTKLGVSVGLMGAAAYLLGLFSGYTVQVLLVGYVLLCEENEWLRKTVVKALLVCLAFSGLDLVIGFIPDTFSLINQVCVLFDGSFRVEILSQLISLILSILNIAEKVLLLLLGLKALRQGTIQLGKLDQFANTHTN